MYTTWVINWCINAWKIKIISDNNDKKLHSSKINNNEYNENKKLHCTKNNNNIL